MYTENLDALLYHWKPGEVMEFLKGPDGHELYNQVPQGPIKPLSLAWDVLDQIESRIMAGALDDP